MDTYHLRAGADLPVIKFRCRNSRLAVEKALSRVKQLRWIGLIEPKARVECSLDCMPDQSPIYNVMVFAINPEVL